MRTKSTSFSFLERDVTFLGDFQDIGQFHLVCVQGVIREPLFRCPRRVVDQPSAASNTFSRPMLQTNTIIGAVIDFCRCCASVEKPSRLPRDSLGEAPETIPLTPLF